MCICPIADSIHRQRSGMLRHESYEWRKSRNRSREIGYPNVFEHGLRCREINWHLEDLTEVACPSRALSTNPTYAQSSAPVPTFDRKISYAGNRFSKVTNTTGACATAGSL